MFRPVPPDADFVALEDAELARWAEHRVFERSVEPSGPAPSRGSSTRGRRRPTDGPGLHHVWARVYKDLFCRFRDDAGLLRGASRRVGHPRPAGRGRGGEAARHHRQAADRRRGRDRRVRPALPRVGARPTSTSSQRADRRASATGSTSTTPTGRSAPTYVQSVWWHLKQLFDKGLLYEDLKVVPYCPRCGTALSSHELGQPDVYERRGGRVGLRPPALLDADPGAVVGGTRPALVVWTTTPWTLPSNTGVAVAPRPHLRGRRRHGGGRGARRRGVRRGRRS